MKIHVDLLFVYKRKFNEKKKYKKEDSRDKVFLLSNFQNG